MTRKEELKIIIDKLYKQLSDKLEYYKNYSIEDKIKTYKVTKNMQLQIDNYIKEYDSL